MPPAFATDFIYTSNLLITMFFFGICRRLVDSNGMVNETKQNLNEQFYEQFSTTVSEKVVHEVPKRSDLPSVTNILNVTMSEKSKAALERWKKNMIEKLGEDGFAEYSRGKIRVLKISVNILSLICVYKWLHVYWTPTIMAHCI